MFKYIENGFWEYVDECKESVFYGIMLTVGYLIILAAILFALVLTVVVLLAYPIPITIVVFLILVPVQLARWLF